MGLGGVSLKNIILGIALCCVSAPLAGAQGNADSGVSNNELLQKLLLQMRELQTSVDSMRSELDASRRESTELRRELESVRQQLSGVRNVQDVANGPALSSL